MRLEWKREPEKDSLQIIDESKNMEKIKEAETGLVIDQLFMLTGFLFASENSPVETTTRSVKKIKRTMCESIDMKQATRHTTQDQET